MTAPTVATTSKYTCCKLHCKRIRNPIDLPVLSEVFAALEYPSILGADTAVADAGRFSYWAAQPREVFEFRTGQDRPFERLQAVLNKYRLENGPEIALPEGVFCGGWIGYFSYELGRYIEKIPETTTDDLQMPLIRLCFYDRVICYDHLKKDFRLIALELSDDDEQPRDKLDRLEDLLEEAGRASIAPPPFANVENIDFSRLHCNMDKRCYLQAVKKIKKYIRDGDVYQVNLSQRFDCDCHAGAIDLFHWQSLYNPSGYAAYINTGDFQIVSASPEMFITITNGLIQTKPIKGTRPRISRGGSARGNAERINADSFAELASSEKEQAELNMIIDLERNDIARICKPGTRTVTQPRTIESYPTVFHAVATVAGRLREDVTFCDVLKAMFPGGSITGAPKIRAMQIIDETEPTARDVYTGSIGFIGADGNVCLNIAIRTIIIAGQRAFVQAGGGIVADSDPHAEYEETIVKARALLAGIRAAEQACRV